MARHTLKFPGFIFFTVIMATLIGCGGGGGDASDNNTAQGTGTVGILLTDKPADPSLFLSINAYIQQIELMGSDDEGGRVSLYSGDIQKFDLLRLRNESIPFSFNDAVPAGEYCKIRLTLADLELVLADDTPQDSTDNETYHPRLPGNGKLDLIARDCFNVVADEVLAIQLDIDAGNSIHVVDNNQGFNFRPVVFVDVITQDFDSKLVRIEGEITEVDRDQQSLLLCNAIPNNQMAKVGCVRVHFNNDSAFFDNIEYEGAPRAIDELLTETRIGQSITVVGRPSFNVANGTDPNTPVSPVLMQLDALVVELGEFLQVEGNVAEDADTTGFGMSVSNGGPVITQDTLAVMFQPGETDINGTRIINKAGTLLTPADVRLPLPVQVDGTLQLVTGSDPILKAALVILDQSVVGAEQVSGTVISVEAGFFTVTPDSATVCGVAETQLQVNHGGILDILTVTITDTTSEIEPGGTLAVGQVVGINGVCGATGYSTDNVVIVDDQRP